MCVEAKNRRFYIKDGRPFAAFGSLRLRNTIVLLRVFRIANSNLVTSFITR